MEYPSVLIAHCWNTCAILLASDLPTFLWTESVQHAVWLKNCTTTCTLSGQTPFEVVLNMKPSLENLPEWGAHIFVLLEGHVS